MGLLIGTKKVCSEFHKLNLPIDSEILDVGAGTAILSTSLQTHGFTNIDALEEDLATLRALKPLRLHRNYICKGVAGLNSTGLRDESYDVIVTSCGISSHCISSTNITELLRILKPGGHLFFTVNYRSVDKDSEFGLFDVSLSNFVKEGKCQIIKNERFVDSGSIPIGDFYMIRRLASQHPEYLDK